MVAFGANVEKKCGVIKTPGFLEKKHENLEKIEMLEMLEKVSKKWLIITIFSAADSPSPGNNGNWHKTNLKYLIEPRTG